MEEMISQDSSSYARFLIGKARQNMFRVRQKELTPYEITPQQANTLFIMYNLGHQATLNELAELSNREINTLSDQMARMEKDGLVKKVRASRKSTLLKFELTEKGIIAYENTREIVSVKSIMSVLSEEERQQLISMLKKIIEKSKEYL